VAPALVPQTAGDRGTTARRAATPRARRMRSGELTPVAVPAGEDEALRDRSRARADTSRDRKAATSRLKACRRRQALRYEGRATWGPAQRRGLAAVVWPTPAPPRGVQASGRAVSAQQARRQRPETARREPVQGGRLAPVVPALQARRGVPCTVAVTRLAARGDLRRGEHPRPLRRALGLTPRADSRGARRRHGRRTTAGHPFARRALSAGAWAARDPATVSRHRPWRLAHLPQAIPPLGWNAQGRRWTRGRSLPARGNHVHPVGGALARDLAAFIWALARAGPMTREAPRPRRAPPS
jgi:transposase